MFRKIRWMGGICGILSVAVVDQRSEASHVPRPGPWLKTTTEELRKLATRDVKSDSNEEEKWKKDVKAKIDEVLDWTTLTAHTLGRHAEGRTQAERDEFAKLLREMVEASYESKLRMAARGQMNRPKEVEIVWASETVDGVEATATAKIKADGTRAEIGFRLKWDGKRWRVYDVTIDDVSTERTYRTQFGKIISEKGFSALLDRMRKKTAEIRSGKGLVEK